MTLSRRARRGLQPLLHAKVRRRHEERTKEQRRAAALLGHVRKEALAQDVHIELVRQLDLVSDLANKHNVTPEKVKKLLMHYRRRRATATVNYWNIHYHAVSLEVNGSFPKGQKKKRAELLQIAMDTYEDFKSKPAEERTKAVLEYEQFRTKTTKGIRSEPKSRSQEVAQTARRITDDLSGMGVRCGTSSMFFTVRTDNLHTNAPCFFIDNTAQAFLQNAFEITPQELASKFENYALSGMASLTAQGKDQKGEYKKLIRELLVLGLQDITKLKIAMEYKNYVPNIVIAHRVMLKGWPENTPIEKNIDCLSFTNIQSIACKLRSGEIYWDEVSEEELRHLQATVPKVRAERSDKGTKRAPYRNRKCNHQGDDVDDNTNSGKGNDRHGKRSRKRTHQVPDSDNDEDDDEYNSLNPPRLSASRKRKGCTTDVRPSSAHSSSRACQLSTQQGESRSSSMTVGEVNVDVQPANADTQPANVDMQPANVDMQPANVDMQPANMDMQTDGSPVGTQSSSARSSYSFEPHQAAFNTQEDESGSFGLTVNASDNNAWPPNDLAMLSGAGLFCNAGGLLPLASSSSLTVDAAFQMPAATQFDDGSLNDFLRMPSASNEILRLPTPPVFGSQSMDLSHPSLHTINSYPTSPNLMFPNF